MSDKERLRRRLFLAWQGLVLARQKGEPERPHLERIEAIQRQQEGLYCKHSAYNIVRRRG